MQRKQYQRCIEKNKQAIIKILNEMNPLTIPDIEIKVDNSKELKEIPNDSLKELFGIHKDYVNKIKTVTKNINVKVRLPSIPEYISENIIKKIIHEKLDDKTTTWACKGDLHSIIEGTQECKCFTSDGPISFTPSSHWDVIYFLDARNWLRDEFILYRFSLKRTSSEWKTIKMNKTQTFEDQTKQGRRPRINWESLKLQLEAHCEKIYEGSDLFL